VSVITLWFDRIPVQVDEDEFNIMVEIMMDMNPHDLNSAIKMSHDLRAQGYGENSQMLAILARHEAIGRIK
jgi:hypothetical protein